MDFLIIAVVEDTVPAAPWWGVPVVAGVFALGGALLSLFFTLRRDRRMDARRWEKDVREVAARLLGLVQVVAHTDASVPHRMDMFATAEELQLMAPDPVARSAEALARAAMAAARTRDHDDQEVRRAALSDLEQAKRAFVGEGRRFIGGDGKAG